MTDTEVVDPATEARQRSLTRYRLAGAEAWAVEDTELKALAVRAQQMLGVEFCAINILDGDLQRSIGGTPGVPTSVSERSASLCTRVLDNHPDVPIFATADASRDHSLGDSPWVTSELGAVRFYAAAPLRGLDGVALGTVCAWSEQVVTPNARHLSQLATIRDSVMDLLDARRAARDAAAVNAVTQALFSTPEPAPAQPEPAPTARVALSPAGTPWSIDTVIDTGATRTLFQPVVHLATGQVSGFEALSRGPEGSPFESPKVMLDAAAAAGRLGELDWLCRVHAMQAAAAANLHPSLSWLINVEPAGLAIECPPHLLPDLARARTDLRVILEVVERDGEGYATDLLHATDQARRDSWGVALDDVGAEEGSLALLPFLRPDVVKLDMSLVQSIHEREMAAITAAVRAYAEHTGAVILAEGIETDEHEQLAVIFGATYGQGYRYGRPEPLPEFVPPPRHVIPLRQRLTPLTGLTPFEILTADREPDRGEISHLPHIHRHLEEQSTHGGTASVLLIQLSHADDLTGEELDRYRSLAGSNALTVVLGPDLPVVTEPRYQSLPLDAASRRTGEHAVIVINPHYAAAFASRDCGDATASTHRRADWTYTHDRDAVIAAARGFLQELRPNPITFLSADPDTAANATTQSESSASPAVQRTGFRLRPRRS